MAVTTVTAEGNTLLFIVPITTQPPFSGRLAVEVPPIEARRVGLSHDKSCWVMLDEINTDVFERSYVFEDRIPLGSFSQKFADHLKITLLQAAQSGKASVVNRRE